MKQLLAALLLVCSLDALAVETHRSSAPIRIDGVLDEAAWAEATPIPVSWEWFPGDNSNAPVETKALVTWDEDTLFVAFDARDPQPARIRARYAERDGGDADDNVGFYIDPFNDDRRAYQFRVNPLGVQRDAINSDVEGFEDFSWDAIWTSAGRITAEGYVVELAIPLQQLRVPSGSSPQTWGFLAVREWPRDVTHRLRSVITDQNRDCLICQFADLGGFGVTAAGRNLEVTPSLTGSFGDDDQKIDAGLSTRWAMTTGTSLQATINPDFSQIEADAAALDVNTRFALSFPERRPFFLEGSDFFETQEPLVFTRTIADPVAGVKLTGKSGPHAYGVLIAQDEVTNFLIPGDQSSSRTQLSQQATSGIFRYRRSLGATSALGGLLALRRGDGYENSVLSVDGFHRLGDSDSLRVQVTGSRTAYPDAIVAAFGQPQQLEGHSLNASYRHADRDWSWSAAYLERSPEFRADTGLYNQVGIRIVDAGAERRIRGAENRWFRNLYVGAGVDGTREYDGAWNEWGADFSVTYQGAHQSSIGINLAPNQEYYRGRNYHNFRQSIEASIQASRDVSLGMFVNWGEQIDFANERPANFVTLSPSANFNIGRRIRGELVYDWQRFETKTGDWIFTVGIPQARLLYHFSDRAFARAILQYRRLDLAPDAKERDLLTQLLFSYRVNAQTVFLAGYSDTYEGIDLRQTFKTVFLKVSYAWLL
ncbi:MAG: carbohydrate binding family 9 domain-containing protein [Acidobacteriota bacterium]